MSEIMVEVGVLTAPEIKVTAHADSFTVHDVVIGIGFHWERKEDQTFTGTFRIERNDDGTVTLVNILPIEDYLRSVISSEMSATSSLELLKAHAVISRSWVLGKVRREKNGAVDDRIDTDGERVMWYDNGEHTTYHVCADDHCQRYQGITRASTEAVDRAIEATRGQVLVADGHLCDARFSKCCGGVFEEFESCWQPEHKSYLVARADTPTPLTFPNLRDNSEARKWIESAPDAFCNTADAEVLRQVLNDYDQETPDFYRWEVNYTTEQISELARRKSGIDFGTITDMKPLERGTSGRITRLEIIGTKRTVVIGKELEIRRTLSESHLYSSAFTVEKTSDGFKLRGAGWGHGVGLCQIGAAVMAHKGYTYRDILSHYFPGSQLVEIKDIK